MNLSLLINTFIVFVGALIAIWFFRALWMVVEPRLILRWADESANVLIQRIKIHNKSKVYVTIQEIQLQITERDIPDSGYISEFVPFEKDDPRTDPPIPENEWNNPIKVLTSSLTIEPGETIHVERAYKCQTEKPIVLCALQIRAKVTMRLKLANLRFKPTERWTTTVMVSRYNKAK